MSSDAEDISNLKAEVARLTQIVDLLAKQAGIGQGALLVGSNGVPQDVIDAIRSGNKIAAIKAWRMHTNSSLADAKFKVEELERGLR